MHESLRVAIGVALIVGFIAVAASCQDYRPGYDPTRGAMVGNGGAPLVGERQ